MRTIWKFSMRATDRPEIMMPAGAHVLSVQAQDGGIYLWAEVNTNAPTTVRSFAVFGTGHPMPKEGIGRFIGTVLLSGGALVFHVFEVTP